MVYKIEFYQTPRKDFPVVEFLAGLQPSIRAKVAKWIQILQEEGPNLKRPYADTISGGIRELRISFGHLEVRLLYFIEGRVIVLTHGFLKKTQQTPAREIERAKRYRADWIRLK